MTNIQQGNKKTGKKLAVLIFVLLLVAIGAAGCDFFSASSEEAAGDTDQTGSLLFNFVQPEPAEDLTVLGANDSADFSPGETSDFSTNYLGREVEYVLHHLAGYRVIIERDNERKFTENFIFADTDREELNVEVSLPAEDEYRVILLALGESEMGTEQTSVTEEEWLILGSGIREDVEIAPGETVNVSVPMEPFNFAAGAAVPPEDKNDMGENIREIRYELTGSVLEELAGRYADSDGPVESEKLWVEYEHEYEDIDEDIAGGRLDLEFEEESALARDFQKKPAEEDYLTSMLYFKLELPASENFVGEDNYRLAFPAFEGEEEEAAVNLADLSGMQVHRDDPVEPGEEFELRIRQAQNSQGDELSGERKVEVKSVQEGEVFADYVEFSRGEADVPVSLLRKTRHELIISVEGVTEDVRLLMNVEDPEEAFFAITDIPEPEVNGDDDVLELQIGETFDLHAEITNTRSKDGGQDVLVKVERWSDDYPPVIGGESNFTVPGNETRTAEIEDLQIPVNAEPGGPVVVTTRDDYERTRIVVQDSEFFAVEIVDTNDPITAGEILEVEVLVTKAGEDMGIRDISLYNFHDWEVDREEFTMVGRGEETITLQWNTSPGDAGHDEIRVDSDDDEDTELVVIEPEVDFQVDIEHDSYEFDAGEEIEEIAVNVSNVGAGPGEQLISMTIDSDALARDQDVTFTESVSLASGSDEMVVFDDLESLQAVKSVNDAIEVESDDDDDTAHIEVIPGDVAELDASYSPVAAGEEGVISVEALDEFGNRVSLAGIEVSEEDGIADLAGKTDVTGSDGEPAHFNFVEHESGVYQVEFATVDREITESLTVEVEPASDLENIEAFVDNIDDEIDGTTEEGDEVDLSEYNQTFRGDVESRVERLEFIVTLQDVRAHLEITEDEEHEQIDDRTYSSLIELGDTGTQTVFEIRIEAEDGETEVYEVMIDREGL